MSTEEVFENASNVPPRSILRQMLTGFWVSQAIYVAAKLGVADLLKEGPRSSDELADTTGASSRELFRLMRFLASKDIFAEDEDGRFELTPIAEVLESDIPGSLRAMAIMYGEEIYQAWGELLHSVRTGETAFDHVFQSGHFQYLAQHPGAATVFDQAMTEFTTQKAAAVITAYDFGQFDRVVDVGGGQGSFITALLDTHARLAGTLFDLPQVVEGSGRTIEVAGLARRCAVVGGNFFATIPGGGDAYIIKNILLNWDDDQSIASLNNCRRAMDGKGKLLVIESVIPPGNSPSFSKLLDLHMLVVTGGRGRTEVEFQKLFSAAGFELANIIPTRSSTSIIEGIPI